VQQPHIPLLIGGHGPKYTYRIAARYCDEININVRPHQIPLALEQLRSRCEEVGRDPATLRVSVHIWWSTYDEAPSRSELLARYREAGVSRVMTLVRAAAQDREAVARLREDALEAGAELDDAAGRRGQPVGPGRERAKEPVRTS
jgi:alkanesulfonate monooxygenase SsuD/methylene tetrahydromethanopterin reductase-like flavin-dependent oxidoreductase (luciferase family)